MTKPPIIVVAALVHAREHHGRCAMIGPFGKGAYQAVRLGLAEDVGGVAELNLRGQDVADEAIALARQAHVRP